MKRAGRAAALAAALLAGCVEREIQVESDPPGADVYVDGTVVGKTPLHQKFLFYGTRRIDLRLDGYFPAEQVVPVRAPWYQIIPLDLFFEHLWPGTLKDTHEVAFKLEALKEDDPEALVERAKKWREEAEKPMK